MDTKKGSQHTPSVRVLMVGDTFAGKSTLLFRLEHGKEKKWLPPTVGSRVGLIECPALHADSFFLVEVWDVGGHDTFAISRPVFYKDFDAVIIVYDVSTTSHSARPETSWIEEIQNHCRRAVSGLFSEDSIDVECPRQTNRSSTHYDDTLLEKLYTPRDGQANHMRWIVGHHAKLPLMVVANKIDLVPAASGMAKWFTRSGSRSKSWLSMIQEWLSMAWFYLICLGSTRRRADLRTPSGRRRDVVHMSVRDEYFSAEPFLQFFRFVLSHKQSLMTPLWRSPGESRDHVELSCSFPSQNQEGSGNLEGQRRLSDWMDSYMATRSQTKID